MSFHMILASRSGIRAQMLRQAGLSFDVQPARIDESAIKESLRQEGARPRDMADQLAEAKARKVAMKNPGARVLGCDQVLSVEDRVLSKPISKDDLAGQLRLLSGKTHALHSAAVLYADTEPVWRHVGTVRLTMRRLSESGIASYIEAHWDDVRHCVGGYQLEGAGVRLMRKVDGDYFHVLGLPLLELLGYLIDRGDIEV